MRGEAEEEDVQVGRDRASAQPFTLQKVSLEPQGRRTFAAVSAHRGGRLRYGVTQLL